MYVLQEYSSDNTPLQINISFKYTANFNAAFQYFYPIINKYSFKKYYLLVRYLTLACLSVVGLFARL